MRERRVKQLKEDNYALVVRNAILIFLLAVFCIGGVELLVCGIVDPALFTRITAPVRAGAVQLIEGAEEAGDELTLLLFPERPVEPPDIQFNTDPAIWTDLSSAQGATTLLESRDGREILSGGAQDIIYYNQTDEAWADKAYGSDHIGRYGCGPVVMAMAVSSLTDTIINPEEMALWAKEAGYWARGSGSYLAIVEGTAEKFGLSVDSCPDASAARLQQEMASGKLAVALMRQGHFTRGGHFILLCGVTLDGSILVADPSSRERSLAVWDAQLVLDELSYSRNDGAPLWFIQGN